MLSSFVRKGFYLTTLLFLLVFPHTVMSEESDDRRVRSGLKQFKSVLAADIDLSRKKTINDSLLLLLVYTSNLDKAEVFAEELSSKRKGNKAGTIKNMPLKAKAIHISELADYTERRVAGVYLTQHLENAELESLIQFGVGKRVVVYSPFEGDVHRGVFVGMSIGTRVHPLINIDTMKASKLRIKSFFLRIAKKYES